MTVFLNANHFLPVNSIQTIHSKIKKQISLIEKRIYSYHHMFSEFRNLSIDTSSLFNILFSWTFVIFANTLL